LLCAAGALTYAIALYSRDRSNRHFKSWLIAALGVFRFFTVFVLAFFLLKPLIKTIDRIIEKPLVVIAVDNSSSLMLSADSSLYREQLSNSMTKLGEDLGADYDLRFLRFGERVSEGIDSLDFKERATDFTQLYDYMFNTFSNRNLGAMVIASDAIYNRGSDPSYGFDKLNIPVYTLALGDTITRKDLSISDVVHNRLAYLGNRFPLEIQIDASRLEGKSSNIQVLQGEKVLFENRVDFSNEREQKTIQLFLEAEKTGVQRYQVRAQAIEGEVTLTNNRRDIFIDVLDSRQKVLILAAAPHPDIAAIRAGINSNENYQVEVAMADVFDGKITDYSLVIFHQLPAKAALGLNHVTQAVENTIPSLFIVGTETDKITLSKFGTGLDISNARAGLGSISPSFKKDFSQFSLSEECQAIFKKLPPLSAEIADLQSGPGLAVLLSQRVGVIETELPLLAFNTNSDFKSGILYGEGIWRWRLVSFLEANSHSAFDELLTKTVQYLASKEDKSLFRVNGPDRVLETENVIFRAELYNESYEPINDSEVGIVIKDEEGNDYPFTFSPYNEGYRLDAGMMGPGNYSYIAKTSKNGEELNESGEFTVAPLQLESSRIRADHSSLFKLSERSGGSMFNWSDIDQMKAQIQGNTNLKSTSFEQRFLSDLINQRWLLFVLIALLSVEWLLRKRNGTY